MFKTFLSLLMAIAALSCNHSTPQVGLSIIPGEVSTAALKLDQEIAYPDFIWDGLIDCFGNKVRLAYVPNNSQSVLDMSVFYREDESIEAVFAPKSKSARYTTPE